MLTITGSYERDEEEYSDFWEDVYLYEAIQQQAAKKVRNTKKQMDAIERSHSAARRGM